MKDLAPDTPSRLRSPDHQRKKPSHFPAGFSVDFSRSLHFRHGFAHLAGVSGADSGWPAVSGAGRQGVSPANDREVGPRYEVLGRNRGFCNCNDRRQWRKQGVAVGTAASETQANATRLLGAATRRCSRRKLPAGLLITIAVTVSFQLTVLIQAHPHPKAGERCAF